MRAIAHVILTPILLFIGWTFVGGFFVGLTGQPVDGTGATIVSLFGLLMLPLGVAYGWRNRHR